MPPKLTVITPSFNQGQFIERTIRSVLDQEYPNLEYVIVDGGSTDGTLEIIKRYEDQLAWWVSEPDEGQADAINKGIRQTSGEIVAYLNSDDYYLPDAFQTAVGELGRSRARWVAGASVDVDEGYPPVAPGIWQPQHPSEFEGLLPGRHWWMLRVWCVPQPSAFWRRELFSEHGLFRQDMDFAFDAEFMLRLAYAGEIPLMLPGSVLATRSVHPEQKSADLSQWRPEIRRFPALFDRYLTPTERRRLALVRLPVSAFNWVRDRVVYPFLRLGGRVLGRVPKRVRPPIRTRDRQPVCIPVEEDGKIRVGVLAPRNRIRLNRGDRATEPAGR